MQGAVSQSGDLAQFRNSSGTALTVVNSAGSVGIGATSPRAKLDVTVGTPSIAGNTSDVANFTGANATVASNNANISVNTTDAQAVDKGGSISLGGLWRAASNDNAAFAQIRGAKTNSADGNFSGYLAFSTRTSGSNLAEAMRIDNSGSVGIGAVSPASLLNASASRVLDVTGGTPGPVIVLHNSLDALKETALYNYNGGTYLDSTGAATASNNAIYFRTNNTNSSNATGLITAMTIASSGNVGIGVSVPQAKFHLLTSGSLATDTDSNNEAIITGPDHSTSGSLGNLFIQSNSTATDGFGGSIVFGGLYTGTSTASFGRIAGVRTGGSYTGALTFLTRKADGTMPERMRIDSVGNVGIGTTSPFDPLDVYGAGSVTTLHSVYAGATNFMSALRGEATGIANGIGVTGINTVTGSYAHLGWSTYGIYCGVGTCGGTAAWTNTSDARLKTAIRDLPDADGLSAIMKLRPVRFHWKDMKKDQEGEKIGFIAQEVEKIFPEVVVQNGADTTIDLGNGKKEVVKNTKAMSYADMVVPLVKAVQELKADNDNLRHDFEVYKKAHP